MKTYQWPLSVLAALVTIMLLYTPNSSMADVYKWEDKKGTTHYTDRKPLKNATTDKVKIRNTESSSTPVPLAIPKTAASEGKNKAADNGYAARCKQAKKNKQILENLQEIHQKGPDGENVVLNDSQKKAKLVESKKLIDIYCN